MLLTEGGIGCLINIIDRKTNGDDDFLLLFVVFGKNNIDVVIFFIFIIGTIDKDELVALNVVIEFIAVCSCERDTVIYIRWIIDSNGGNLHILAVLIQNRDILLHLSFKHPDNFNRFGGGIFHGGFCSHSGGLFGNFLSCGFIISFSFHFNFHITSKIIGH